MKKVLLLIAAITGLLLNTHKTSGQITAAGYTFTRNSGVTYTSILPSSTVITMLSHASSIDSTAQHIPIGFIFNYCGTDYTTLSVDGSAWLSLADDIPSYSGGLPVSRTGLLMPFHNILGADIDTVSYNTTGVAPYRTFTLEFRNVPTITGSGSGSFQVKLFESTNMIKFCYGPSTFLSCAATVGIANSATDYQTLPSASSTTTSSTAFTSTLTTAPAAGTELIWTPPPSFSSAHLLINTIKQCSGPLFTIETNIWSPGYTILSYWGDGSSTSEPVIAASGVFAGTSVFNHSYLSSGTYTIKHILYDGVTAIDSISYTYEHILCLTVPIRFYYDNNNNCIYDNGTDIPLALPILTEIDSNGLPIDTISATSGFNYFTHGMTGDIFTFRVISMPTTFFISCPSSGIIIDTLQTTTHTPNKYIAFQCGTGTDIDLAITSVIAGTGVHNQSGSIYLVNNYCHPADAYITFYYSPKYNAVTYTNPTAYSHMGNSIIWHIPSVSSVSPIIQLSFSLETTPYLTVGDTVNEHIETTTPTGSETTLANNNIIRVDTTSAAWDPNSIQVSPSSCFTTDTQFTYTIHFENTGNDTAHNIYVMDTLSDNLDVHSLRIVMASKTMNINIIKAVPYTIARFDFPDINLPDSSHHGLCDAAVIYTIKNKPGIPSGVTIKSQAGIYFDINPAVMTNQVENTKGCPVLSTPIVTAISAPTLYPNPATDELTLQTPQDAYSSFTITNSIGQQLQQPQPLGNTQTTVSVKALPAGVYYVTFKGDNGSAVRKFVKL